MSAGEGNSGGEGAGGREDAAVFSFGFIRNLLNEPALLHEIRAGTYKPKFGTLEEALANINKHYYPTAANPFTQAKAHFDHSSKAHICAHLNMEQKIAAYVYTMVHPPYYRNLNSCLYGCENGNPHIDLELLGDVIYFIWTAICASQAGPDAPAPDKKLVRIAHIPDQMYVDYYKEGAQIVCKAFSSAATAEQWQFVAIGQQPNCTPVVLEFDEKACGQAVDIRQLSAVGDAEDERLFFPFFRGTITKIEQTADPSGRILPRVYITGLPSVAPTREVLDPTNCTHMDLLDAALLIGLHCVSGREGEPDPGLAYMEILENIERAMAKAVVVTDPNAIRQEYRDSSIEYRDLEGLISAVVSAGGSAGLILLALIPVAIAAELRRRNLQKAAQKVEGDRQSIAEDAKASAVERDLGVQLADLAMPSVDEGLFEQVRRCSKEYIKALDDLRVPPEEEEEKKEEEDEEEEEGAAESVEERVFLLWLKMWMQLSVMQTAITGKSKAFTSPFPIADSERSVVIGEGDALLTQLPEGTAEGEDGDGPGPVVSPARYVVGNLGILRELLARTKVIVPLGAPDAGKSTLLRKVYGINCPSGLSVAGRTRVAALYPHPTLYDKDHAPVFVADVPGFGDVVSVRDQITKMILGLATKPGFRSNFVVQVCICSGRPVKSHLEEVTKQLEAANVPFEFILTKVDKNYEARVVDLYEKRKSAPKTARKGMPKMTDRADREKVAAEIKEDDKRQVGGRPFVYACLSGWAAAHDSDSDIDSDSDSEESMVETPALSCITKSDVDVFFQPLSAKDMEQRLNGKL
jgi:GTP-binding protein EngB required for normal cell division